MFLKCELFYPLIETYFPLQLYNENIRDASDSCIATTITCLLKELKVNVNQCVMLRGSCI